MGRTSILSLHLAGLLGAGLATSAAAAGNGATRVPSDAIKLDQVGYQPDRPKLALVVGPGAPGAFSVRTSADGSEALKGMLGAAVADPDTGDSVRAADFSALRTPGSFYLDVAGVGRSHDFEVASSVHAPVFYAAMRSFYGLRCGTAVDLAPTSPGFSHRACHVPGTPNPDAEMHVSSGAKGPRDATGGWHDAGDYGKYVVNSGITTGELLLAYELFGTRLRDVKLDLPESGNQVPDMLDEVRWNLEWMLKMQDGDGGVWHKLTSARFGGFVLPELDDGGPRYVIGSGASPYKTSCATADFAAVMAIAARVFKPHDAIAAHAGAAAERAWTWVERNPALPFRNCCGVQTGEYGDTRCEDELLWAAAELFRTTGRAEYGKYFKEQVGAGATVGSAPPSWGDVRTLAAFAYAFSPQPGPDPALQARIRADAVAAADAIVARTSANPYRVSLRATDYVWGSNGVAANYGVVLLLTNQLAPKTAYVDAAADNLHYLLGRNTFGLSWITQVGDKAFLHPHHRPSGADANEKPWPGLLSGGPNRHGGDAVIDRLPASPPARRYADDQASYASNENAINWNAALVFLLAGLLP